MLVDDSEVDHGIHFAHGLLKHLLSGGRRLLIVKVGNGISRTFLLGSDHARLFWLPLKDKSINCALN